MELKDLKAGDKVIVVDSYYGQRIKTIEKITPTGFIKVDGFLYYNTGSLRGSDGYYSSFIKPCNKEDEEKILLENKRRSTILNCKKLLEERMNNLSYNDAKEILEILLRTK